jgi:hypothetical protein
VAKKVETPEERKARLTAEREERRKRQARELARFVRVLRRAGNRVKLERFVDPTGARRWRIDVAVLPEWVGGLRPSHAGRSVPVSHDDAIAIEVAGRGRHQSIVGFRNDLEKDAECFARGWTVLRVSREMVASGDALEYLARRGVRVEARR